MKRVLCSGVERTSWPEFGRYATASPRVKLTTPLSQPSQINDQVGDLPVRPGQSGGILQLPAVGILIDGGYVDVRIRAAICIAIDLRELERTLSLPISSCYKARDDGRCAFWSTANFSSVHEHLFLFKEHFKRTLASSQVAGYIETNSTVCSKDFLQYSLYRMSWKHYNCRSKSHLARQYSRNIGSLDKGYCQLPFKSNEGQGKAYIQE